jgi:hypothetical protein
MNSKGYALRMTPKSKAIIAITKRIWIRPPPTGYTKAPNIHPITKITAIK